MTSVLRTYTSLKPSGIRWQSDVPKHWHVRRLRTVAEMRDAYNLVTNLAQTQG